ncbi:hypothetical protein [Cupriavidus necator]
MDDDLARLVEKLANPKPFEHITFNDALRRVLEGFLAKAARGAESAKEEGVDMASLVADLDAMVAEQRSKSYPKKAPSPSAHDWAATVPELKSVKGLSTWKAICDHLNIKTAGDSARRKLQNWVKDNRPKWPAVPDA